MTAAKPAPRVFIPQIPSRFDTQLREWVPSVNIAPARKYGELIVMLPPEANRLHTAPLVASLKESLRDFGEDDYLVAVGDPSIMMAAGAIVARRAGGRLRLLKWDRREGVYLPVEINV